MSDTAATISRRGALTHEEAKEILRLSRRARFAAELARSTPLHDSELWNARNDAADEATDEMTRYVFAFVSFEEMDAAWRARNQEPSQVTP